MTTDEFITMLRMTLIEKISSPAVVAEHLKVLSIAAASEEKRQRQLLCALARTVGLRIPRKPYPLGTKRPRKTLTNE